MPPCDNQITSLWGCVFAAATLFQGSAFAGVWHNNDGTWQYYPLITENGDGWQWIDIDQDGVFECYYLSEDDSSQDYKIAINTTVDGYTLNSAGQWTVNGEVQTRTLPSWLNYSHYYSYTVLDDPLNYFNGERVAEYSYPLLQVSDGQANQRLQGVMDKYLSFVEVTDEYSSGHSDYQFILNTDQYASLVLELAENVSGKTFFYYIYLTITPEKGVLRYEDIGGDGFMEALNVAANKALKEWGICKEGMDSPAYITAGLSIDDDMPFMLTDKGIAFTSNYNEAGVSGSEYAFLDIVVPYSDIEPYLNDYGRQLIGL